MAEDRAWYESHAHTPLCHHAQGEPEEYAAVAERRGLRGLHITCHGPTPHNFSHCMALEEFGTYTAMVERARNAWAGRVDVRIGLECDYTPELEPWWRSFLPQHHFHHVLGSVHPMLAYYREQYDHGDLHAYQRLYFAHLAQAAESGLFDTLAHPDLIKNQGPETWEADLDRLWPDIEEALDRVAATGVAMELNTSGRLKARSEMNPGLDILHAMRKRAIPVVIGGDAHRPDRVAEGFDAALDLLEQADYEQVSFFLDRQRHDLSLAAARATLRPVVRAT